MSNKVILLYHHKKSVKTIEDFIKAERINTVTAQQLFEQNKEYIFSQMTMDDKWSFMDDIGYYPHTANDLVVNMVLPCPCKLKINPKDVTAEIAINQTNLQTDSDDFFAFENEQIQDVVQEEPYSSEIDRSVPTCQVIGWFKSLYYMFEKYDKQNNSIDVYYNMKDNCYRNISSDVISMQTNVGKNGGNFTIRLPHIAIDSIVNDLYYNEPEAEYLPGSMKNVPLRSKNVKRKYDSGKSGEQFGLDYFSRENFNSDDYYSNLISNNDLLFISFNYNEGNEYEGLTEQLKNGNYDLIGLVDDIQIVKNPQGSDYTIQVSGRDLMKLLIEDGSFFFNPSVVDDSSRIFWNAEALYDKEGMLQSEGTIRGDILSVTESGGTYNPLQRMIGARDMMNMISVFAHRQNMEIGFVMKAVISQLSNIEVVPGYIFEGFPNRTTFNELQPKEK